MADPIPPSRSRDDRPQSAWNNATQVAGQLGTLWGKQSRGRRLIAIVALLAVIGVVAWTRFGPSGPKWVDVAPGAGPDDAAELGSLLANRSIPYRLTGRVVEVPEDQLDAARAVAAAAGLPRTGAGFELFDKSNLGQTAFAEQVNYRRALQGELGRSITAMTEVDGARVHIAMGRRSVFKDGEEPPSASVALRLHPGQQLTREQVQGIRQLIAASVDGLKPDAVVIVDGHGNPLDASTETPDDQRGEIERAVAASVRNILEHAVGPGHVAVVATAELDTSKVSETEELYDKDKTALRSENRTVDGPDAAATAGGIAGVRGNLPGTAAATTGTVPTAGHVQITNNYEVSRIVRQTAQPDVRLKRLHLAILIDQKIGADGKPVPRTPEEMAELAALARQAAGLDDARGDGFEIRSIPFLIDVEPAPVAVTPPKTGFQMPPTWMLAAGGGALLLIVITAFMILRSRRNRRIGAMAPVLALPAPVNELERALDGETRTANALPAGPALQDRLFAAVRADAPRAAAILTSWLAEPASKGARA